MTDPTPGLDSILNNGGGWSSNPVTSITIPTGATSGERVVIDSSGANASGIIRIYDVNDLLVATIDGGGMYAATDLSNLITGNWIKVSVTDAINGNPAFLIHPGETVTPTQDWDAGRITTTQQVVGVAARQALSLFSPTGTNQGFDSESGISIGGAAVDGSAGAWIQYMADRHIFTRLNSAFPDFPFSEGIIISCSGVAGSGGGVDFWTNGGVEQWQTPGFTNGWAAGAATPLKFRRVASPSNSVQLYGSVHSPSPFIASTIFTLPVGYRPPAGAGIRVWANRDIDSGVEVAVASSGTVQIGTTTAGVDYFFSTFIQTDR